MDKGLVTGSTGLLVLALLRDGEKYGYQMITELAQRSQGVFELREGTLYPILHQLERDGYVRVRAGRAENGRERRYYRLTKSGEARLEEKTREWVLFSEKVNGLVLGVCPQGA